MAIVLPAGVHSSDGEEAPISVRDLTKVYRVSERSGGVWAALRGVARRQVRDVPAVNGVSFSIQAGEMVGFLGPNGAGKTTTLKMLAGLLHPTSGEAHVLGHVPWRRERAYLQRMTLVMGQRNQLLWDLPAMDTLLINRAIYRLPEEQFRRTVAELTDLLDLRPLLGKQVRQLSLGERMKCELAAALLHRPAVLFLDEPTIGLDVTAQARIRDFIHDYNRQTGATVLLTSHYMADVTALCQRVIVIHHGTVLYDGALDDLSSRMAPFKVLGFTADGLLDHVSWEEYGELLSLDGERVRLRVPKERIAVVTGRLLASFAVVDLTIEDPPIEAVIDRVFTQGLA